MLIAPANSRSRANERKAKPYCKCWNKKTPLLWKQLRNCSCGEDNDVNEWRWSTPDSSSSWVVISEDRKQVTFHPFYSSGTAVAKGDTPLLHNYHHYWEVKILTDTYGTDIMVGLGTDKVDTTESQFKFTSLLGQNEESYGLSYTGAVRHNGMVARDSAGFCRGSIVGVRVDLWRGTLEFYLNRKPLGISFYNLRRHRALYPMVCSTAAQSSMRLIYAASWRASLLVDAAKVLASARPPGRPERPVRVPPGLWYTFRSQFWLTLPSEGGHSDEESEKDESTDTETVKMTKSMLNEVLPDQFVNGYYVDGVEPDYRIVVRE
ncbi:SPRY domain-containing SOCS box protein 3-like isoform X1 [Nymphalis io]|uniref:SPRY domain-containing SOCS box protein 3-like isoform X1 n=1 Tax=Inachis io TaxID=171585 RepID=UPI00216A0766|nr:SPRY domain-containing SOCS box protein 3-like isoform X1 [Nymphalis io]XP_050351351.1 SPRY domain-containing SOCS box protein 3-like isoform X1 [Nymphalis io]